MSSRKKRSHPTRSTFRIWFQLVNASDGESYKNLPVAAVSIARPADVDLFRDAVWLKFQKNLRDFDSPELEIFADKSSFDERYARGSMDSGACVGSLGQSRYVPLLVAVPQGDKRTETGHMRSPRSPPDVRSREINRSGLSSAESPTPQQAHKKLRELKEGPRIPKTANPPFSSSRTAERDDAIGPSSKQAWMIFLDNLLKGSVADRQSTQHMEAGGFLKIRRPMATGNTRWTLWSEEVMNDVREVSGLSIPVDSVRDMLKINETVVLIGVGGCGKTQTCFDLCRTSEFHAVYLDWSLHGDLLRLAEIIHPPRLNPRSAMALNEAVTAELERILTVRLYALRYKKQSNPEYSPDQYFRLQQTYSGTFGVMCGEIPKDNLHSTFLKLVDWARKEGVVFVIDEAQFMLNVLQGCFHSNSCSRMEGGKFVEPRSLLSFVANFLRSYQLKSVWAGTDFRIFDVSLLAPGGAGTVSDQVFTKFNYLTADMIMKLVDKWIVVNDETLKIQIAKELQGRPRFFISFIEALGDWFGETSDTKLREIFAKHLYAVTFDPENVRSLWSFWDRALNSPAPVTIGSSENVPKEAVIELLNDLLCHHLLWDTTKRKASSGYQALVSTAIAMLTEDGAVSICEPIVIKSGIEFLRKRWNRDYLEHFIWKNIDEGTRGKAVEMMCAGRCMQSFWKQEAFADYFPPNLVSLIKDGIAPADPLGVLDHRTGSLDHQQVLEANFLTSEATHVVLPRAYDGLADVIYGFFSFHIKTKWTDLVITRKVSDTNNATIHGTIANSVTLQQRARTAPWVRICFEFPTSKYLEDYEMNNPDQNEIVEKSGEWVTVTAGIESRFSRLFFGETFIRKLEELMRK